MGYSGEMHILAIYGSLRTGSHNKALASSLPLYAPDGMTIELVPPGPDLPLFNEDMESEFPASAQAYKDRIAAADGVIFVTPEYNRGMPGVLKNFIDWTSRPSGKHPWKRKAVGVMGVSSGPRGTIVAQYDLKRTMNYFGADLMGSPEFYVDNSGDAKVDGIVKDDKTVEYVRKYLAAFQEHIQSRS